MTKPLSDRYVAVLMGGLSPEREVSLVSGRACAAALERLGAKVTRLDAGRVQGVLETLAIPYTHSGVLAAALAMDKAKAKSVLAAAGVTVPGGGLYDRREVARRHVIEPPYVVKPNAQGSSVGVFLVFEGANTPPQEVGADGWAFGEEVMVEPYIAGKELAVAVRGTEALTVTEIVPTTGCYDYDANYADGASYHVVPAPNPDAVAAEAKRRAGGARAARGGRGGTRAGV